MFEEFQLYNMPVIYGDELPSVVRVGAFNHKRTPIPILFPFESTNGICYVTKDDYDQDVSRQMEYIALELLKSVSPDLLKVRFIDIGITTRYPIVNSLKNPNISFITDSQQMRDELQNIMTTARFISTQCLGYQYKTLADYNSQNENKEPYYVFFISNFPKDFSEGELQQLSILIREAKNCGVHFVINISQEHLDGRSHYYNSTFQRILSDIYKNLVIINCVEEKNCFQHLAIPILNRFADRFGYICDVYNLCQVEQIVNSLQIKEDGNRFSNFLSIPIGRSGRDVISLEMGQSVGVYHGFIAGQSGTGKSNLLNKIITSIAQKYTPDELRLYLLDYKLGVEFQVYRSHPNVEVLMLDNENFQAGIDVLQQLKREMVSRAKRFLELGATINNIDEYNRKAKNRMPRILMIVDEVQQLFNDFEIRRKVSPLVKEIAKQGRAFGIHLLFSSQSYVDCKIDDDILSQMSLRIAFTLSSSAECRAILGPDNTAPMKLPQYSAIVNTKNGDKEFNIPVKVDYFDKESILPNLEEVSRKYNMHFNFKKQILVSQDDNHHEPIRPFIPILNAKRRGEYDGIDFSKEFGF